MKKDKARKNLFAKRKLKSVLPMAGQLGPIVVPNGLLVKSRGSSQGEKPLKSCVPFQRICLGRFHCRTAINGYGDQPRG